MSSNIYSQQNPSPTQTRRAPVRNDDVDDYSRRQNNSRSLSSKFRNLFRKNSSSSPNRSTYNDRRPPLTSSRQRSPSPEPVGVSTEAPHIRAPTVSWTFGKKKTKSKQKTKITSTPLKEVSNTIYQHKTSIRGQNFVPRTPELPHGGTVRTQSASSYEATTKGFRDYMTINHTKSPQQVVVPRVDASTPPLYTSDHSRSPSLDRHGLRDPNIEYSYHRDTSPPITDLEIIRNSKQYIRADTPSLTASEILARKTPLVSPKVTQPISVSTNPNQWKNTSYSSLNNPELRSTTSSSKDCDVPKLKAPLISFGSTSNKKKSKRAKPQFLYDGTYNSLSTSVNNYNNQPNQSYTKPFGSLSDTATMHNDNFSSLTSTKTDVNQYPGLNAILEQHVRPTAVHFDQRTPSLKRTHHSPITTPSLKRTHHSPITTPSPERTHHSPITTPNPERPQRFEVSTTVLDDYDPRQQWSTNVTNVPTPSPSSIPQHDGYIRPLSPKKSPRQPDLNVVRLSLDDLRGQSPPQTKYYRSAVSPNMYRSSTVIYTKDKHNYGDGGGELRTWSVQGKDGIDKSKKPSTSIHVVPSNLTNEKEKYIYEYGRQYQQPSTSIHVAPSNLTNEKEKYIYEYGQQYQQPSTSIPVAPSNLTNEEERYIYEYAQQYQQPSTSIPVAPSNLTNEKERYIYEYGQQYQQPSTSIPVAPSNLTNDKEKYIYEYGQQYQQPLYSNIRYSENINNSNLTRTTVINERDKIYDPLTRSYTQEARNTITPVENSEGEVRHYTLKRTDSYDGLGILVSADVDTRLNHRIRGVESGSPGFRAGLRRNDRIININGVNVENVEFGEVLILIKQGLNNNNLQISVI